MSEELIYHCCPGVAWRGCQETGAYTGSPDDARDGFIHFSALAQVRTSTANHRAGQAGLILLVVAADKLGPALKWEPSRGGQLFPHLYGPLPLDAVVQVIDLPLGADGEHQFPEGYPD
ncbi:MAG: DUF952 domain-containing protein [Proteobacteria bacterium]|nr:DUF952 domain-containing protein [Pseudomonadota bacterium]